MNERESSLDLLRSIAICSVFMSHAVLAYGPTEFTQFLQFGASGVDLFFVLSGWLLGNVIFKELQITGTLDVRRFWYRRWLRTIPAYVVVLLFLITVQVVKNNNYDIPIAYFFFLQNYFLEDFFYISWSLALEEQFYLAIAPLLLFLFLKSPKKIFMILIFLLLLPIFFRFMGYYSDIKQTHVRVDGCVMGVLLAYLNKFNRVWFFSFITKYKLFFLWFSIIGYLALYIYKYLGYQNTDKLLHVIVFSFMLISAINYKKALSDKASLIFKYIATRSYSIYLLHPIVFAIMKNTTSSLHVVIFSLVSFLITCLLSEFLYRLVELKFMDMREVFSTSKVKFSYKQ